MKINGEFYKYAIAKAERIQKNVCVSVQFLVDSVHNLL